MTTPRQSKQPHAIKRRRRKDRPLLLVVAILLLGSSISYTIYMHTRRLTVDPASYAPLLSLIAKAESNDNYNAYFGSAGNQAVDFTSMPLAQILAWQADFVGRGNASSAVGRYQIIDSTLAGLIRQLGIDPSLPFSQPMQDSLAIALLERRGVEAYINKEITREEFAANLAKEWAGLPRVLGGNPEESYYASDGLNKSRVSVDEVLQAIELIQSK